jgi:hypothetical protein
MRLKNILEDRKLLPDNVIIAFEGIADAQRSGPEQVMLRIQFHNVGGVLNPIVEHVGDISHRMTEHAKYGDYLQGIVLDKCVKSLRILESRYGFVREMEENNRSNGTDVNQLNALLMEYANAHSKIPAYNPAQYAAREAAVSVGKQDWNKAIDHLKYIVRIIEDGLYNEIASSYEVKNGELVLL